MTLVTVAVFVPFLPSRTSTSTVSPEMARGMGRESPFTEAISSPSGERVWGVRVREDMEKAYIRRGHIARRG